MPRTVHMELLRPEEIRDEQKKHNIVFLPLGPLEWHGPAMPYGTDPLFASAVAEKTALKTGGLVMSTLWMGTERKREDEILRTKGFEDPLPYVKGMDVPKNMLPSMYAREDVFGVVVREYLRMLVDLGFKLIVIVNGHGAVGQRATLERLAVEFSNETSSKVIQFLPLVKINENDDLGHGTKIETSLMCCLHPESVDLNQFPAKPEKLKYVDYGLADDFVFSCHSSPDNAIVFDPRDADESLGKKYIDAAVAFLNEKVLEAIE